MTMACALCAAVLSRVTWLCWLNTTWQSVAASLTAGPGLVSSKPGAYLCSDPGGPSGWTPGPGPVNQASHSPGRYLILLPAGMSCCPAERRGGVRRCEEGRVKAHAISSETLRL